MSLVRIQRKERETTLRQLIFKCIKEVTKNEGLMHSEIHTLTEHILSNSCLSLTANSIDMKPHNFFGIGENNKDRNLTIPRFLTFDFGMLDIFTLLESKERTWQLRSHNSLESLENNLRYSNNQTKTVALLEGEIVGYAVDEGISRDSFGEWLNAITWEADIYKVSYILEDREEEKKFQNRFKLEQDIKEIVRKKGTGIKVKNIIEDFDMHFTVTATVYNSYKEDDGSWSKCGTEDEYEEEDEVSEWCF